MFTEGHLRCTTIQKFEVCKIIKCNALTKAELQRFFVVEKS